MDDEVGRMIVGLLADISKTLTRIAEALENGHALREEDETFRASRRALWPPDPPPAFANVARRPPPLNLIGGAQTNPPRGVR